MIPAHGLMPVDLIVIVYFSLTAILILPFRHKLRRWYLYLLAHLLIIIALFSLRWFPRAHSTPTFSFTFFLNPHLWMESYPLFLVPILYREVSQINRLIRLKYLDDVIIRWEGRMFFGQPSIYLSERFPSVWLSEFLHFCYFSYYFLLPGLGLPLYWGNLSDFRIFVFGIALTFEVCCILYILFPVLGPYYQFRAIGDPLSKKPFYNLTRRIIDKGTSKGTAFPSSHVAISVVVLCCSLAYIPGTSIVFGPAVSGLIFSTVYCRFHYALDAVAGLFTGLLLFLLSRPLFNLIAQ